MESLPVLLLSENARHKFHQSLEAGVRPKFQEDFTSRISQFLHGLATHIPANPPTSVTTQEGTTGFLPPAAKKIVVTESLQGNPIPPVKVSDEHEVTGKPRKDVDTLTLHLITEVNHETITSNREIPTTVESILSALHLAEQKDITWDWKEVNIPSIRARQIKAILHLVKRGIAGQYEYVSTSVSPGRTNNQALQAYKKSLSDVLKYWPNVPPSDDFIAHQIINQQIKASIDTSRGPRAVAVPIVVNPKHYYVTYHGHVNTLEENTNIPYFVLIAKKELSVIGRFEYGVIRTFHNTKNI